MLDLDALDFKKSGGLVTVVTQDARSGAVLMVAHADREALERTLATGEMHYRSRRRGLWRKGGVSGNIQRVVTLAADCDGDAVLARVVPVGPACHTGETSCFGEGALAADAIAALDRTIASRAAALVAGSVASASPSTTEPPATDADALAATEPPASSAGATTVPPSYTQRLLADRNLRLKKLGEETTELVTAIIDGDRPRAAEEAADLLYHTLVALRAAGLGWNELREVLARRAESPQRLPER